ncbi:MAG: glycosyltransferase family 39 protein [Elusimicrobia bacterium]|nr:glycosyltransferase family 39 protein [Elusimicrobiota bacterium]
MTRRSRELALVVGASLLLSLPFLGKGFHVDEPFFLDRARELLFGASWAPRAWSDYNNNPPVILWLLAAATRLAGENEIMLRALFLPFDALAAASLYLLFARFLKKPLAWTLLAVFSPAYALNMGHIMAEKPAMAFGAAALCALVKGAEERRTGWLGASAALLSAAVMSKYAAIALFPAAAWYLHRRCFSPRVLAVYSALALSPLGAYLLWNTVSDGTALRGVATTMSGASVGTWGRAPHRARSLLAFFGGLAVFPMFWPLVRGRGIAAAAAAAAAFLFLPFFDSAPVRPLDRAFGAWLATGALVALFSAASARGARGRDLWLPWLLGTAAVASAYWSVIARVVLFAVPPLVLALGSALEERAEDARSRRLPWAAAAAAAALSLSLGWVDFVYAGAQKDLAAELSAGPMKSGRVVWCAAKLGLRHYLLRAGARPLDSEADWEKVRPGDLVVFARTTTNFRPARPRRANVERRAVASRIPLRLISGFGGEGGFYSNVSGFLPFSPGMEPVEEFTVVEPL